MEAEPSALSEYMMSPTKKREYVAEHGGIGVYRSDLLKFEYRLTYMAERLDFPIVFDGPIHANNAARRLSGAADWDAYAKSVRAGAMTDDVETELRRMLIHIANSYGGNYIGDSNTQCLDHQKLSLKRRSQEEADDAGT